MLSTKLALLVVDDEPLVLQLVERMLPEGVGCVAATSVEQALTKLETWGNLDGLLVDVGLEDGSGFDVLSAWRARYPHAPAIVMTGADELRAIANRACAANSRFVTKPFGLEELEAFLASVYVARWRLPPGLVSEFLAYATRKDLSSAQADLLAQYVGNVPRQRIAGNLRVSENTLKTRVRQLCRKVGLPNLERVYEDLNSQSPFAGQADDSEQVPSGWFQRSSSAVTQTARDSAAETPLEDDRASGVQRVAQARAVGTEGDGGGGLPSTHQAHPQGRTG